MLWGEPLQTALIRFTMRSLGPPPGGGSGGYQREEECTELFVRNLPRECSVRDLYIHFERHGVVKNVHIPRDYYTGQRRGIAFVKFSNPGTAASAQHNLDHQLFLGREITVEIAKSNRKNPQEMRNKERARGRRGFGEGHRGSQSSCTRSRSRSPRRFLPSLRGGRRSRSLTPPVTSTRVPSPGLHSIALPRSPSPVISHGSGTSEPQVMSRRQRSPSAEARRERSPSVKGRRASPAGHDRQTRDGPRGVVGSPAHEPSTEELSTDLVAKLRKPDVMKFFNDYGAGRAKAFAAASNSMAMQLDSEGDTAC